MSTRLVFQDRNRKALHEEGIALEWGSPVPKIGEIITLPDGQRVKAIGRQFHYVLSAGPATDLKLVFDCEPF